MEKLPFNLADLKPKETSFTLEDFPKKTFVLCRWSLRVRGWAIEKYGYEGIQEIFTKQKINEIGEMVYFMLKDKADFPTLESFLDAVASVTDQLQIIYALLGAVGMGEPEIKALAKATEGVVVPKMSAEPLKKSPKKTGPKSSTR